MANNRIAVLVAPGGRDDWLTRALTSAQQSLRDSKNTGCAAVSRDHTNQRSSRVCQSNAPEVQSYR